MLDPEMLQLLKEVPAVPEKLFRDIYKNSVITGSKVLGGFIEGTSDIDLIVPHKFISEDDLSEYAVGASGAAIDMEPDYKRSFYIHTQNGKVYNILIMHSDEEFWIWVTTTTLLKT
jgi:hypothetical protein